MKWFLVCFCLVLSSAAGRRAAALRPPLLIAAQLRHPRGRVVGARRLRRCLQRFPCSITTRSSTNAKKTAETGGRSASGADIGESRPLFCLAAATIDADLALIDLGAHSTAPKGTVVALLANLSSTGAFRTEAPRREKSRPTPNPDRDDVRKVHLLGLAQGDRPPGLARSRRATPKRDRRERRACCQPLECRRRPGAVGRTESHQ
jgi:hypothetical protein